MIFSTEVGSSNGEEMRFSTARMTPCLVQMPTAVEPVRWVGGWVGGWVGVWWVGGWVGGWVERRTELDGLNGVLHLEEPAFGGESVDAAVVLGTGGKHGGCVLCGGWVVWVWKGREVSSSTFLRCRRLWWVVGVGGTEEWTPGDKPR